MERPYIGITGFKTEEEVRRVAGMCAETEMPADYGPMFGVLCSAKRLSMPEKPGKQSPSYDDLPDVIASINGSALPMVHYFTQNYEYQPSIVIFR